MFTEHSKLGENEKAWMVNDVEMETTEAVTHVAEGTVKPLGTSRPRHPRSTIGMRRSSKVFVDPTYSDYSLSWITKDDFSVDKWRKNNDTKRYGSDDGRSVFSPVYSWTPSPAFFQPSPHTASSHRPRGDPRSDLTPLYSLQGNGNQEILAHPHPDQTSPDPSKGTPYSGKLHCCSQGPVVTELSSRTQSWLRDRPAWPAADGSHLQGGVLYIGGIFELSQNSHAESARSELDAALLAISHVNEKRIVPGYVLELVYNDSKVMVERE